MSAHRGEAIAPEEERQLEDPAAYLVRSTLSLQKLVYLDGEQALLYRSRMNPLLGRNFEAMDPLEWLARLSDQIPDPRLSSSRGRHRVQQRLRLADEIGRASCRERVYGTV